MSTNASGTETPSGRGHIWLAILVTLLGVAALIESMATFQSNPWISGVLINVGTTILLFVPLLFFARHMEARLDKARADTQEAIKEIDANVQKQVRDLKAEFRALQTEQLEAQDRILSDILTEPSARTLSTAIRHFSQTCLISSRKGIRISLSPDVYMRIEAYGSESTVHCKLEDLAGARMEIGGARRWSDKQSAGEFLSEILDFLESRSAIRRSDFDPEAVFIEVTKLIQSALKARQFSTGEDRGPAVELSKPQWLLYEDCIGNLGPEGRPYQVNYARFKEQNWRVRMGRKTWVDYESFDRAMFIAESLKWAEPYRDTSQT